MLSLFSKKPDIRGLLALCERIFSSWLSIYFGKGALYERSNSLLGSRVAAGELNAKCATRDFVTRLNFACRDPVCQQNKGNGQQQCKREIDLTKAAAPAS
jgi:hypothetical protein